MCTVAQQAKLLHRINRRSLFLTVQAGIRCRCTAHNQGIDAVPEDMLSKPRLWIQTSAHSLKTEGRNSLGDWTEGPVPFPGCALSEPDRKNGKRYTGT